MARQRAAHFRKINQDRADDEKEDRKKDRHFCKQRKTESALRRLLAEFVKSPVFALDQNRIANASDDDQNHHDKQKAVMVPERDDRISRHVKTGIRDRTDRDVNSVEKCGRPSRLNARCLKISRKNDAKNDLNENHQAENRRYEANHAA